MSINEIAKHLNVSKSTVSLVINGKAEQGRISQALAERILTYVQEIGYKPNVFAKSLATGRSHTIGLIVENISDSFYGPIALHIEKYLRKIGYHVFYSSTLGSIELGNTIVETMLDKKVEGLIVCPTNQMETSLEAIQKQQIPLVIFDRKAGDMATNYVGTDNYGGSLLAVDHLLENGFQQIGLVTNDSTQSQMIDRLNAYTDKLSQEGFHATILRLDFQADALEKAEQIKVFLRENPQLDALYFTTNYLCIAGLKAIQALNREGKYAIISFDDHELFELLQPAISCVEQPVAQIAQEAINLLFKQKKSPDLPLQQVIIPSKLIKRKSTC